MALHHRFFGRGLMGASGAWAAVALVLCLGADLPAQTDPPAAAAAGAPISSHRSRSILIGPADTLTIVAPDAEEISKAWRVGSTGHLNLPMLGRIYVAGMTVERLESELLSRLKKFIIDPHVIVYISEYRSEPVTVVGAVEKPGTTQIHGANGLFDVLMLAGGTKNPSGTVTVTRRLERGFLAHPTAFEQDGSSVVVFLLTDVMDGRGVAAGLPIEAGDVITVSDFKEQRLVYVVGDVNKPGAVELATQDKTSLLRLLAVAGGLSRTAAAGGSFIRHTAYDPGKAETTPVNVKRILEGKEKDVAMLPGDILVVPSSKFKGFLQTASQSALTSGIMVLARF